MADNVTLDPGSGGSVIAADDIVGILHQRVKIEYGADGSATDVSATNPLPVILASNSGVDAADVTVNNGTGASAVPIQDGGNSITVDGTVAATQSGTWTVQPGNTANTTAWKVDGSAVTQPVSGTFWQTTQPVSAASLPLPSGAATAAKQPALGTAGTASSDVITVQGVASMTALKTDGSGVTQPVSAASLPLPTGAATAANQATGNTSLATLAGAVSGTEVQVDVLTMPTVAVTNAGLTELAAAIDTEVQVDVVGALPTGDNAIGRVKLTDGTDVADVLDLTNANPLTVAIVDGDGSQITSFGGGTQYTEGATDSTIAGTAMLWEDTSDTLRVPSASKPLPVAIISGAGSGGTAIQDGAAFAADTTNLTPVGGYRDDTSPATVTEGDAAAARITEYRALHVNLRDEDGNEVSVGGGTQYTEAATDASLTGTVAMMEGAADAVVPLQGTAADGLLVNLGANNDVTVSGVATSANQATIIGHVDGLEGLLTTIDADTGGIATSAATIAGAVSGTEMQVDVLTMPTVTVSGTVTANVGTGTQPVSGTFWQTTQPVSLASVPSHAVTNAGTFATQVDGAALTALQLIDNPIADHDAAAPTGTSQVGLEARTSNGTAVASGDATRAQATVLGKQVVKLDSVPDLTWSYAAASGGITNTTAVTIKTAAGSGVRNYLKSLSVVNGHATVSTEVLVRDGAGGTVLHRGFAQAAGGGYAVTFDPPLRSTANTLLEVVNVTTGAATYVNASGYTE